MISPSRESAAWPLAAPVAVAVAAFALYLFTAAREPQFGDGLEFVAAAAVGGVPHPTGYPLLMMLLAPVAQGAGAYFRATLVCGLFVAAAAGFLTALAARVLASADGDEQLPALRRWLPIALGLTAAASASLWGAATHVEVYGLNAFFLAALLFLLASKPGEALSLRQLALASFLLGLAATNHITVLCLGPLLLVRLVESVKQRHAAAAPAIALCVGLGIMGLLPYLYLPLRAAAQPPINWGDPQTLDNFLWSISGGDYKKTHFLQAQPGTSFTFGMWLTFAGQRALMVLAALGAELLGGLGTATSLFRLVASMIAGATLAAMAFVGIRRLWIGHRAMVIALLLAAALQLVFVFTYNIPDITDYLLGVWLVLFPFFALGARQVLHAIARRLGYLMQPGRARRLGVLLAGVVLIALASNWSAADRSRIDVCAVFVDRLVEALPPGALIVTHGDYDTYALWYAQHAEGRLPGALVVAGNFMRNPWYQSMLPAPAGQPAGHEIRPPQTGSFRLFTVEDHARMLAESAIEPNLTRGPVLTTVPELALYEALARRYALVPRAVLLTEEEQEWMRELYPASAPPLLMEVRLR